VDAFFNAAEHLIMRSAELAGLTILLVKVIMRDWRS
jgi:hypothetical protein